MDKRRRRRPSAPKKTPKPAPKPQKTAPDAPEVVQIQPPALDRKRLMLRLTTVAAVVLALFIGFSIFFRVDTIVVSGNQKYTAWTVREVSGIREGESLLTFGKAKACAKIAGSLPYVKVVRIGIKLPGTVNIYIEEVEVVYAIQDQQDAWWLMTAEGRLTEKTSAANAAEKTVIRGVVLEDPKPGEMAVAVEEDPEATTSEGETQIVTVTNAERLETALSILQRLEANEILGQAAQVDVTDMGDIQLWYGEQYQVLLGDPGEMDKKVDMMAQTIQQMGSYQSGILDITFSTDPGAVIYRPFK